MVDYRSAGVDIDEAERALAKVKGLARSTYTRDVLSDIGGFGGLFRLDTSRYRRPVLVASTDGVGTKLKIAFATGRHPDVGYDIVAHSVNDVLVQGARPLFFLDYLASGKLDGPTATSVIEGMAEACREFGVALLGGETAEMPGFYAPGEYDIAGTIVGVVEEDRILDGSRVRAGDSLLALPSTGLHTNGYSLARKILLEQEGLALDAYVPELSSTVSDALMARHRCYLPELLPLLEGERVHALAHITGGGLTDNVPRVIPDGLGVCIDLERLRPPAIFRVLMERGRVTEQEMLRVFNLGVGMVVIAREELELPEAWSIGEVIEGRGVSYESALPRN